MPLFTIIVTVYQHTSTNFFKELVASIVRLKSNSLEVVLLAHGPIPVDLSGLLLELPKYFRVFRESVNFGIVGGMKYCLGKAKGDFIIPVDADDLLARNALTVFEKEISSNPDTVYFYSDEDFLIDGSRKSPYRRPDWDPVLSLDSSYIWHLTCFSRTKAIELGIYSDLNSEYCHDWDTLQRFDLSRCKIKHVPKVLYHWRQHSASNTNNEKNQPNINSLNSQKNVLSQRILKTSHPDLYGISEFPFFRGAVEYYIHRKAPAPMKFHMLEREDLESSSGVSESDYYSFIDQPQASLSHSSLLEALKIFDFVSDVAIVTGPTVDKRTNLILSAAGVQAKSGKVIVPMLNKSSSDPGPFAIGLKPHCVDFPNPDFWIVRGSFLNTMLGENLTPNCRISLANCVAQICLRYGRLIATSPLVSLISSGYDLKKRNHALKPLVKNKNNLYYHYPYS